MKKFGEFVTSAFLGGLLIIVPIYLTVLLLFKAMQSVVGFVKPFARLPDHLIGGEPCVQHTLIHDAAKLTVIEVLHTRVVGAQGPAIKIG